MSPFILFTWWMVNGEPWLLNYSSSIQLFIVVIIACNANIIYYHGHCTWFILHGIVYWYLHGSVWCSGAIIDLFIYWITQYLVIEYLLLNTQYTRHKTQDSRRISTTIKRKFFHQFGSESVQWLWHTWHNILNTQEDSNIKWFERNLMMWMQ